MTAERMSGGSGIILKDRDSWYAWYGALKLRAYEMRVWHQIDPDEQSNDEEEEPEFPAFEKARARLLGRFLLENAKTAEPPTPESLSSGSSEPLAKPPFSIYHIRSTLCGSLVTWIERTIDSVLYRTALLKLVNRNKTGIKELLRTLREMLVPSKNNFEMANAGRHVARLKSGKRSGIKPRS
ncbi:hypothetical protein P885DRAFT_80521 [Corynascus similis CBS 632.67]